MQNVMLESICYVEVSLFETLSQQNLIIPFLQPSYS